jgi:two-component system sensor histidine kinase DctS
MIPSVSGKISVGRRPPWRWLAAIFVAVLFFPVLLWLPWQAQHLESTERQEQLIADTLWVEQTIRFQLGRDEDSLRVIAAEVGAGQLNADKFRARLLPLMRNSRELRRVDWFDGEGKALATTADSTNTDALQLSWLQKQLAGQQENKNASYFQPPALAAGEPAPLLFLMPIYRDGKFAGQLVASFSTVAMLEEMVPWWFAQDNEISLVDNDDTLLARRIAGGPGRGIYTHRRQLDLPGVNLALRTNSIRSAPTLLPNLLVGSVVLLSVGLLWSLWALWRDINRRIKAEVALRQQVAFRSAMENSLQTGMRARDLEGRVTYVNPAFCKMVGIPAEQLVGMVPPMPYWAPEAMEDYQRRFSQVLSGKVAPQHETVFQRADGERFPVLIFESPLVDESGKQTGWMGSLLDISDRRRAEDLNRQQQEKLQASARLATMGEMASALAHELNQPLAAISSYTTGALNLLNASADPANTSQLKQALEKASTQAQRAGQIIRSVHTFVKKREPLREPTRFAALVDSVMPLIDLQARPFFVNLQINIEAGLPQVMADRVMLEQVLLNLTRNGIEAMRDAASAKRLLRISAGLDSSTMPAMVVISVGDQGHGISTEVGERLFSPFFSTKADGMGMGLNICRTVIEFHGGVLTYKDNPGGGTVFRFTLPALEST